MAGPQGAETGAVQTGYNAVEEAKGNIDTHLQVIRDQIVEAGTGWKGDAYQALVGLMNDFDTSANNLQGVLNTLSENLRSVEGIQATQESNAADAARGAAGQEFPGY